MALIDLSPGYMLPQYLEDVDIDEHLVQASQNPELTDDVILDIPSQDASIEELMEWINSSEPTDADNVTERSGFSTAPVIKHDYALHYAAREGNTAKISHLIERGYDVNYDDNNIRSARPLYFAAKSGHFDAASLLIKHGANITDTANMGDTALHVALKYQHYDVAVLLVINGANPKAVNKNGEDPLSYLLSNLYAQVDKPQENGSLSKIDEMLKVLSVMLSHCEHGCVSSSQFTEESFGNIYTPVPVETTLLLTMQAASSQVVKDKIKSCIDSLHAQDTSHQTYLHALNLLHRFPTGGNYALALDDESGIYFKSEGHFGLFTTELARDSLCAFKASLPDTLEFALQKSIFTDLHHTYENALDFLANARMTQTYEKALSCFEQGETVLLPTGWNGHFVDVILSKQQATYAVANSGERYAGEAPMLFTDTKQEQGDNAGVIFYELQALDKIDRQYFEETLNNTSQENLELELPMKYGMLNKLFEIHNPDQEYGNCSWESHRDAVEGIIVIELLNRKVALDEALPLAKEYYEAWDKFHGNYVIEQYMAHQPGLQIDAMLDILKTLHDEPSEKNHAHAQKIVDVLTSDLYIDDFTKVIQSLAQESGCEADLAAFEAYHVDVKGMLAQTGEPALLHSGEYHLNETQYQPHFNIAHQMMTDLALQEAILI